MTDELLKELVGIKENLAVNNRILEEHHQRSMRLEKMVELVEKRNYQLTVRLYILIGALSILQPLIFFMLKSN
jgi:hypothetical protein